MQAKLFALPDAKLVLNAGAEFSECGKYRYKLWRIWDDGLPLAMCIGLNPSTANAVKTDPTITTLTKMLKLLGYGGFYMMNLFAWISSKPIDLLICKNPIGENDVKLKEVAEICNDVIVCWGNFEQAEERVKQVLPNYPNAKCFGKTQRGRPFHPLALMYAGMAKEPKLSFYNVGSHFKETNKTEQQPN
ncbi:MAG TPA: DUF1643 domain-containing protein [Chitinophagales bacterium]|nr:DUF1643 domain-containing protein [Chitinophagales bacterium]